VTVESTGSGTMTSRYTRSPSLCDSSPVSKTDSRALDCWWLSWPLFIFLFFDLSRRWQEYGFPIDCSALSSQLLRQRVPALRADIIFLVLNFPLHTIFCFAAQITSNHGIFP
jgi:hypothetical protein